MFRRFVGAVVVLAVALGVGLAEEIKGKITKISDESVSIAAYDKETKKYADAKSYPLAKDAKFIMVKKVEDKEEKTAIEGGAKASVFTKLPKDGLSASVEVKDSKVVEIRIKAGKKKS